MTIQWESIQVAGAEVSAYVARPDEPGPHPGIVVAHHGSGVDEFVQDVVHRLHRHGYAAIAPDLFHRQSPGLETMQRIALLRDDEIKVDMKAAADHLALVPGVGRLAVIGHCMGGRVAWLMACEDNRFRASAVFYGGNIRKSLGDGPCPLDRAAGISGPMLGLFGDDDTNPSPADVALLSAELTRLGKRHKFHSYRGAGHAFCSFANPQRFRPRASRAAWAELLAFLDFELKD